MKDEHKIKEQLTNELVEMRQRVAELEGSETERRRAEEALRESERRYRLLAEHATDVIWTMDMDLRFTYFSPSVTDLLGYSLEEAMAQTLEEVLTPASLEVSRKTLAEALAVAEPKDLLELELNRKDGSTVWTEVKMAFLRDPDGRPVGILGVARDITERKGAEQALRRVHNELEIRVQERTAELTKVNEELRIEIAERKRAEEALRVSEERFALAVRGPDVGLWDWDIQNNSLYWSPRLKELLGYADDELDIDFETFESHLHPDDRELTGAAIEAHLKDRGLYDVEQRLRTKSGEYRWFRARGQALWDEAGNPVRMVGSTADITEHKRAEEALRESEEKYRTILENIEDGYYEVDIAGNFTFFNDSLCRLLGYPEDELMGMNNQQYMDAENAKKVYQTFNAVYRTGKPAKAFDWEVIRKDRTRRFVEASVSLISDSTGEPAGFRGIVRDITERKRAEEALHRERDLAEALEEATAALTATLDFDQVLDRILEQVSRVVPNDATNIMLIEGDQARVVRWRGYDRFGEKEFVSTVVFRIPEVPGLQQMMESGEPTVIPDTATYPGWVRVLVTEWLRSYAAAPIIVRGEVIGFLNVDSATPGFFTQAHAETLRAFADHAAAAIENARLYEAEQERRHIAETLRQASTVLNSTLELDEVLRLILQQLRQVIPYDSASVQRLQDAALSLPKGEHLKIVACQGFEEPDKVVGLVFPLDPRFPNYRVVRTKAPLAIQDITQDYPHFKDEADTYESGRIRSWLGVPLMVKDEVIGMIAVDREEVHAYTAEEAELTMAFANQAAIAIENAQLYEETQRQSERLAQTLALSELLHGGLELEQVLEQIAQGTVELGFGRAVINICQPEEDLVRVRAVAGLEGPEREALMGATYRWSDFQAIMQEPFRVSRSYVILHGKVDWERDFQGVVVMPSREDRGPGYWHAEDMLLVPLWGTRGEPVGLLSVDEPADGLLPDLVTIQTLEAFANQAATAIENALLFEETRRRALQLQTVEEVGRRVSSILDLDELFPYVTKAIQRNFGYHHVDIFLVEPATGYAVFKASSDPALEKAWREQGLRFKTGEEGMIGLVAHTGEPLLANDVSQEPHYLPDELLPETKSQLVVPLKVEERVVGVLDVDSDQLDAFDEDDLFVLQTLANQIAIGIENARLFEETERLKAFNESIVQGMSEGIVVEDLEGSLTYVNPSTTAMLGYSRKELVGQHWTIIVPPDQEAIVQAADERRKRGEADRYEIQLIRKDGTRVPVLVSGSPWFEEGRFAGTLAVFTDITARKRMEKALRDMALVDDLTGLYNRRGFFTLAEQQLKTASRMKNRMLLLFADFDYLKRINDALGHPEGDRALIEVADAFKETFRESDIIARIGGDEFVVLAVETNRVGPEILTTRLQENLEARNAKGDRRYKLSLSVGIARYDPESPCSIDELLARADRAMYEQKEDDQKS